MTKQEELDNLRNLADKVYELKNRLDCADRDFSIKKMEFFMENSPKDFIDNMNYINRSE